MPETPGFYQQEKWPIVLQIIFVPKLMRSRRPMGDGDEQVAFVFVVLTWHKNVRKMILVKLWQLDMQSNFKPKEDVNRGSWTCECGRSVER